jgi:hypothetical protein
MESCTFSFTIHPHSLQLEHNSGKKKLKLQGKARLGKLKWVHLQSTE